jgi:hypothetical protein
MKIRLGFVSNSSSSSYLILFPENFNINELKLDKKKLKSYGYSKEDTLKDILGLIEEKIFYSEDVLTDLSFLASVLEDFVIGSFDGGADSEDQIHLADVKSIKKILSYEKMD